MSPVLKGRAPPLRPIGPGRARTEVYSKLVLTMRPIIQLSGNFFPSWSHDDTTWLAFEGAARTHACVLEHSPAPKFLHFPNLHDALIRLMRTHMGLHW
eukprot:1151233-Pelagomonas_calceolata.AAC.2